MVYTAWKTTILCMAQTPAVCDSEASYVDVAMRTIHCMQLSALALTEVPAAAHAFLSRGVHHGALIMTCLFMRELNVPILPLPDLCQFFRWDPVSPI